MTRLWLTILFFSTSLSCSNDGTSNDATRQKIRNLNEIQENFVVLLWKYLLHRHGQNDAVRIFSNLIRIYLEMQSLSHQVALQIRQRSDLSALSRALSQAVVFDQDRI